MNISPLMADTFRQYGYYGWRRLVKGVLFNRTFRVVIAMRLCQAAASSQGPLRFLRWPLSIFHQLSTQLAGVDFPWQTKIGAGLALTHGWGLVVNAGAVIGKNVTLFNGVTLGRRDHIKHDGSRHIGFPIIEDEVWIGPHAIIVGGITVGQGSRIAGGAFVVDDVPPHSVVVGNPALIIKTNCIPDVMNRI